MALGCFAAGMVTGTLLGSHGAAAAEPFQELGYVEDLVARYQLTSAQRHSVQMVLQNERAEESSIRASLEWGQLPPSLQNKLLALRAMTRQRIRVLLDPDQRARFDRDSEPAAGDEGRGAPAPLLPRKP
ncbi:MAG: hypothetical protein JNL12_12145 [Planctomycetes bacterium]|nr:hypothetical protein [Planctomycetota bacterium]